jgi:RNA polymerase sigma-70 factor (ECF subfamily)
VVQFRKDLIALLPRLHRFALALSSSPTDADDLIQAAVERALRHQHSWKEGTRLDSWMYKIIQNLWVDELRARRRRADPINSILEIAGDDGRNVTAARIDLAEVRAVLATLPEEQRVVLTLVVLDGMKYQEAADVIGVPIGTIMSRLARARAAIAVRTSDEPSKKARKQWST